MGKRIISFSLYGDNPDYLRGALRNVELARRFYPEWTCRFYVSQEISDSLTAQLRGQGAEVIRKRRNNFADGKFWRFLAIGDPEVDCVIVRDVDSHLGKRDRDAVDAWLASGRGSHIMRDHPLHRFLIMAGLWGCRRQLLPDIEALVEQWLAPRKAENIGYGADEVFLGELIYPRIKDDVLIHSDYVAYEREEVAPFPSARINRETLGIPDRRDVTRQQIEESLRCLDTARMQVLPPPSFDLGEQ